LVFVFKNLSKTGAPVVLPLKIPLSIKTSSASILGVVPSPPDFLLDKSDWKSSLESEMPGVTPSTRIPTD